MRRSSQRSSQRSEKRLPREWSARCIRDERKIGLAMPCPPCCSGKVVVVGTWPGLLVGPFTSDGYARQRRLMHRGSATQIRPRWWCSWPSWPNASQPTDLAGWKAALLAKHTFALAGFLVMATETVYMQYEVRRDGNYRDLFERRRPTAAPLNPAQGWYNGLVQGAVPCPEAPASCAAPDAATWYPDLFQPLGPPLGPAVRSGNVWTRSFAHATAVLDVGSPDASSVTFA